MRLCAVSVDLDEIPNYYAIHGLPPPDGPGKPAVYDVALDRLETLSRSHAVPLTLFAIGSDLQRVESGRTFRPWWSGGTRWPTTLRTTSTI